MENNSTFNLPNYSNINNAMFPDYSSGINISSYVTGAGYSVPDDGVVMFFTMPAQQEVYVTIGGHTILHKGNTSGNYAVATCPIVKKGEKFWAGLFSGGTAFFFPFKKEKITNAYFIKY